ncbi:MAG: hypothetical protein Q9227_006321 [Pyrenula ochraceoflavens]
MPFFSKDLLLLLLAISPLVAGHGAIVKAVGDAGGQGSAIGIDPSTPRDGTTRNPFEQDTTRFKGDAKDTVGETLEGGTNDIESGVKAVMQNMGNTMPQITPGGMVMMTLHQVNSDGAGPYTCGIDSTGTAQNFEDMTVTQNVPGTNSRDKSGSMTDHPLNAQVPAGQTCTGSVAGQSNVCMVRCMNAANAGPFGGVVAVQMSGSAGNSTTSTGSTGSTSSTGSTGSTGSSSSSSTGSAGSASASGSSAGTTSTTGSTGSTASTGKGSSGNSANSSKGNASNASGDDEEDDDEDEEDEEDDMKRSIHFVGRFEKVRMA